MHVQTGITIEDYFKGKPAQLHLFKLVSHFISSIGPSQIKITKSQISFTNKRQFVWVWLPVSWDKKRPLNSLVLSFSLKKKVKHPQIVQTVEPYPGRWMHHVILDKETDLSKETKEWIRQAYKFSN